MTRSLIYFACVGLIVTVSLLLRFNSAPQRSMPLYSTTQPAKGEPPDFVIHPLVAFGEETKGPARIISLAPSITETLCALGLRNHIVGRTQYCTYPPGIEHEVESVGALQDTNYEKIKSLHPDVVFVTWNSFGPIAKLQAIGLRVEQVPHETLDEVYTGINHIGEICNRPRTAQALADSLYASIDRLTHRAAAHPHPQTHVLMTLSMRVPPQQLDVIGADTFFDTLLTRAGYANAVRRTLNVRYGELPLEKLAQVNPDVILDFGPVRSPEQDAQLYAAWQQIPHLRAIENHRVVQIGGPDWTHAGPRVAIELHRFITRLGTLD